MAYRQWLEHRFATREVVALVAVIIPTKEGIAGHIRRPSLQPFQATIQQAMKLQQHQDKEDTNAEESSTSNSFHAKIRSSSVINLGEWWKVRLTPLLDGRVTSMYLAVKFCLQTSAMCVGISIQSNLYTNVVETYSSRRPDVRLDGNEILVGMETCKKSHQPENFRN